MSLPPYKLSEPKEGEPRQPNKAYFQAIGPYEGYVGRPGSPSLDSAGLYEIPKPKILST